jgi:hypothetical protein
MIHQHWYLPIITNSCLVLAHIAIPRPGVSANLYMACPSVRHGLRGLTTPQISRRPPQALSEVGVIRERPSLFALKPTTAYVFDGVELSVSIRFSHILGKVLAHFNSMLVQDTIDLAGIEQFIGIDLSIRCEG